MCVTFTLLGILFAKDKGQHILKNPLVVNSMIEKVHGGRGEGDGGGGEVENLVPQYTCSFWYRPMQKIYCDAVVKPSTTDDRELKDQA